MAGFFARGTMKPPAGAQMNWAHPFARDLRVAIPFNENYGVSITDAARGMPSVIVAGPPTAAPWNPTVNGTLAWTSTVAGPAGGLAVSSFLTLNAGGASATDPIPTTAITILLIRRKTDTTARNCAAFGGSVTEAEGCSASLPYGDGLAYWIFGGFSGGHTITASGVAWDTNVERWVFTAGPQGSSMWRNGVKLASQSTAITRTASTSGYYLNGGAIGGNAGDNQQIDFFQISGVQWSDDLSRWWSAEPYAHLYTEPARSYLFLSHGSDVIVSEGVGSAVGTCTVSGVSAYRIGGAGKKSGFGNQKPSRRRHR